MAKFKTRARTLDMLGRQQIAGIPTAISELFKNAHDAYADHVEVDYYRGTGLFVLRDDGIGMTKDDFIDRWLSIGTESKLNSPSMEPPSKHAGKKSRATLGEKGIGRLAIAKIGPQVLILTRAKENGSASELTAAFINWSIFECPGIDLEDIDIPIKTFPAGQLPSREDVVGMVEMFGDNLTRLQSSIESTAYINMEDNLQRFIDIDPREMDSRLGVPSLSNGGTGTHFIIMPSSDLLPQDIDGSKGENTSKAPPLRKFLLGFTNTISPKRKPSINVSFRDHDADNNEVDLLSEKEFFTQEDFKEADHYIVGKFDKSGRFSGDICIYGKEPIKHTIEWGPGNQKETLCGPFTITLAAIEGESRTSRASQEDYARIIRKTDLIGGLYIYRNGIRILPYGDTDFDWLDIELRRSKGAGYYYYSHRKMFGAIEIDAKKNSKLTEKAGREGFQENKAYREFRSILIHFLLQTAAEFFREGGEYSEVFKDRRHEIEEAELNRRQRSKEVSKKERKFEKSLKTFFKQTDEGLPEKEVLRLKKKVSNELQSVSDVSDPEKAAEQILEIEKDAQEELAAIWSKYEVVRPKIGLRKNVDRDWRDYKMKASSLVEDIIQPAKKSIEDLVSDKATQTNIQINRKEHVESFLRQYASNALTKIEPMELELNKQTERIYNEVKESIETFRSQLKSIEEEVQDVDYDNLDDEGFFDVRNDLESRVLAIANECSSSLEEVLSLLTHVSLENGSSMLDTLVAIEQRNMHLEEEMESELQLAQIGIAIEILNHEFNATIRSIRGNLRRMKDYIGDNKKLAPLYKNVRTNFDHLDGYLTLFTPLHRRLYRKQIDILGSDIYKFLSDLFEKRLERHNIKLVRTRGFSKSKKKGYPSTFYPVFINLVDNAIFWLSEQSPSKERLIRLHAKDDAWIVMDTGPGINVRDQDVIFDYRFTRKPGGLGLGLHISREMLRRVGYDLELIEVADVTGAAFAIQPLSNGNNETEENNE